MGYCQSSTSLDENFGTINYQEWFFYNSEGIFGRTRMGNVAFQQTDPDNTTYARLPLDKWHNGIDKYGVPYGGRFFKGVEMVSFKRFGLDTGPKEFTARIRLTTVRTGAVAAIYPYSDTGSPSYINDEIDYEFLGQQLFSPTPSNNLWLNLHNNGTDLEDVGRNPRTQVNGIDWRQWQIYRIRWYSDRVEWYINGVLKKTESITTASSAFTDGLSPSGVQQPLQIHFNHWVPDSTFPDAYYSGFTYANSAAENVRYFFDVDWVRVVTINRSLAATGTDGVASLDQSEVSLSNAEADATANSLRLVFTGALDEKSVSELSHYVVSIDGVQASVDSAVYESATHSVVLRLKTPLASGSTIVAACYDLRDAQGLKLTDQQSGAVVIGKA